ncbi:peptidoglycan-binding protein [Aureimonas sp. SA4125]|uniref:N-acetylmuramidase domain-containing protein n=1 Tax=Aureimonas sp. SA4125 TaxID=2826993 RepID=UPI001CC53F17|nr:N-acetylmuramidase domain-containing protein [Aureimonas sp. SA4125]BDA86070.1 peptidoglycan-binding protein [Aureimonas sp. SA4125]
MALNAEVILAARKTETSTGVTAAVLLAIATVETNGVAYAAFDGRREPLIRFEGHYFDRLLEGRQREGARAAGLADPRAGAVRNPLAQAARWRILDRAAAIDPAAAFAATSWGLGQVMGAHWRRLGYGSPQAMAAEARQSAEGQFAIMARFLKEECLEALLPALDFAAFARRYNGPAYRRNGYDRKIKAAYAIARRRLERAD